MFGMHVIDKQIDENKLVVDVIKNKINLLKHNGELLLYIRDTCDVVIKQLINRHKLEIATVLGISANRINLNLLYSSNALQLQMVMNNYISKLKIIEDKRTILNILVNFFKNQKMVEIEFNATMRMYREAPRLPFLNFKEGEGHLDFFSNFMVKAKNFEEHLVTFVFRTA
jgi:hypothetical protein